MNTTASAPAPWFLSGNGFILLYYFGKDFLKEKAFMTSFQKKNLLLNVGALMLMDYQHSNAGPYQELLFIPGLFSFGGRRSFSVSKIYVSSQESQWNGCQNWGLPKERAHFSKEEHPSGKCRWIVGKGDKALFEATLKAGSTGVPFSSRLVPWGRIVQETANNRLLLTAPVASGKLKPAAVEQLAAAPAFFPPVQEASLLAAFSFQNFRMKFPVPWHIG